ncbi:cytochrome c oxidase assembly protein [Planctomonas deserti]|uniref:cytochrome c oxidase assembly protein n=1 Tax=Planctomonas deserti TaxID=2144185 RepID=UPI000D395351|nr:cytochrome c oxidase assembly protein [Planctomonas deserti]
MRIMGTTRTALVALVGAGLLALTFAFTLSRAAEPALLDRTGPLVIWGLPMAKLGVNVAASVVIGALLLAVTALSPGTPARRRALVLARAGAVAWSACALVVAILTFQTVANLPILSPEAGDALWMFFTIVPLGRATVAAVVLAATTAVLVFTARSRATLVLTGVVAFAGTVPLVLNSHAAGGRGHADSTVAVVLHVAGASVWLGGLLVLIAVRSAVPADQRATLVRRYSTFALAAFIVLAVSGVVAAWAALGTWSELFSAYGALVLAKTAALGLLFLCGAAQRLVVVRALDRRAPSAGRHFAALVVVELTIMGAASGVAAALARTTPPAAPDTGVDGALLPVFGVVPALTQWRIDPLWLLVCGFAAVLYLGGVRRLRSRGEGWPVRRSVLWLSGVALLFVVTNGGLHMYQGFLLSAHAATQAVVLAVVPLLLVGGAPGTLIERTVEPRRDGTLGALEVARSLARPARWISTRPHLPTLVVALALTATLASPLQRYAALAEAGYSLSVIAALAAGTVFALAVVPAAGLSRGDRLFAITGAAIVIGAFGAWIRAQAPGLEEVWFRAVGNPWGDAPAVAPEWAGPLLWSIAGLGLAAAAVLVTRRSGAEPDGTSLPAAPAPAFGVVVAPRVDA